MFFLPKKSIIFLSSLLFPLSLLTTETAASCNNTVDVLSFAQPPAHIINYRDDLAPDWKKTWDRARMLFVGNQYEKSLEQYRLLLEKKKNIDQARWEYISVLICLKKWQKAAVELSQLINNGPENQTYELARAEIALGLKDYKSAAKLFAHLYAASDKKSSCKAENIKLLKGYVVSLKALGEYSTLLPFIEELVRLQPADLAMQKSLVEVALQNDLPQKALFILKQLARQAPGDVQIFQTMASLYQARGNTEMASTCWQQVIGIDPDNIEANTYLIDYYAQADNPSMQLKHVEHLLSISPNNRMLILQAADLYRVLHRSDKALDYYNQILTQEPGNSDILSIKNSLVPEVVEQLLALINGGSSVSLWQELVRAPADKKDIYKSMAEILRVKGKKKQLLEVLIALQQVDPVDMNIPKEINLLKKQVRKEKILASSEKTLSREPDILSH